MRKTELLFLVEQADDGVYTARAVGESIFTEAETMDGLRDAIREAVDCHFDDGTAPQVIRLHIVHDEVLSV